MRGYERTFSPNAQNHEKNGHFITQGCNLANFADKEGELRDDDFRPLTLERVATERNGVHHCEAGRPEKSRLFRIILADDYARPRHSPFLCPIFVVLFCKLKHKTGILRARNNSVSQWCGAAEDWSVFRCISRRRAQQRALQPGSANESAAGRVPSQSETSLVASRG